LAVFDRLCENGILCCLSILLVAFLAEWSGTDYGWRGILMIALFYMLRRQTIEPWICRGKVNFQSQAIRQIIFVFPLMSHHSVSGAILPSIAIFLYYGTRGYIKGAVAKYGFHAFYPLNLTILQILK